MLTRSCGLLVSLHDRHRAEDVPAKSSPLSEPIPEIMPGFIRDRLALRVPLTNHRTTQAEIIRLPLPNSGEQVAFREFVKINPVASSESGMCCSGWQISRVGPPRLT